MLTNSQPVLQFQPNVIPWRLESYVHATRNYQVRVEEDSIVRTVTFRLPSRVQLHTFQAFWRRPSKVHALYVELKISAENEPSEYPFKQMEFERVTLEALFNYAMKSTID